MDTTREEAKEMSCIDQSQEQSSAVEPLFVLDDSAVTDQVTVTNEISAQFLENSFMEGNIFIIQSGEEYLIQADDASATKINGKFGYSNYGQR